MGNHPDAEGSRPKTQRRGLSVAVPVRWSGGEYDSDLLVRGAKGSGVLELFELWRRLGVEPGTVLSRSWSE